MEFTQYVRKPFVVEAIEITADNICDVADLVGKFRTDEDSGQLYISLDRRIIPNVGRAYVGWWLTRLGDNYRCYAPKVFNEQFAAVDGAKRNVFEGEQYEGTSVTTLPTHVSVMEVGKVD